MKKLLANATPLTFKILRLVKGLNKFTVDDIQKILSENEQDVLDSLNILEEESIIKKISKTEYLFINIKVTEPSFHKARDYNDKTVTGEWVTIEEASKVTGETLDVIRRKCKRGEYECTYERDGKFSVYFIKATSLGIKKYIRDDELGINLSNEQITELLSNSDAFCNIKIEDVLKSKTDCEFYNRCTLKIQKALFKHLVLFKVIGDLTLTEINAALKIINKKYPDYTINNQWYRRKLNRFKESGLSGLYNNQLCSVAQPVYDRFKELYLSPNGYGQCDVYEIIKSEFGEQNIPTLGVITHRLRNEFSKEAVRVMKSIPAKRGRKKKIQDPEKELEKAKNIKFEEAAKKYFNSISKNPNINIKNRTLYYTYLVGFFKDYTLGSINEDIIDKFKVKFLADGFSASTLKFTISMLLNIISFYGIKVNRYLFSEQRKQVELLSLSEIKSIIKQNTPQAWIIGMGLRIKEIEILEYEDIDFETNIATISKLSHGERKSKFYSDRVTRYVKVPKELIRNLDRTGTGRIFKDIKIDNYEQLIFAHVMLMQINKVPMNLIAKQMGYNGLSSFYPLFKHLFPQQLEDDFNIFEVLNI